MTMKGKDKKQEVRVTRSKSPARGQSPAREPATPPSSKSTPSKQQRGRSRSRSKSPARTPAKAGSLKAESSTRTSRKSESTASVEHSLENKTKAVASNQFVTKSNTQKTEVHIEETVTRSSRRIAALHEPTLLTQRKFESAALSKNEDVKLTDKPTCQLQSSSCMFAPLAGILCSTILIAILLAIVSAASLACNLENCSFDHLPKLPIGLQSYFDVRAVLVVLGWVFVQLLLTCMPVGWKRDSTRMSLSFRCNGLISLILVTAAFVALHYKKPSVFKSSKVLFLPVVVAFGALAFISSLLLYIKGRHLPTGKSSVSSRTGFSAFVYGREVQPCIGPLNFKLFCVVHMAVLGWALLNGIATYEAYRGKDTLNTAFIAVAVMQFIYIFDIVLFQASLSNSLMMTYDTVGFVFTFVTLVWVPFIQSVHLRFLLAEPQNISHPILATAVALFAVGYVLARRANYVKDKFRQNQSLYGAGYQLITTPSGKSLLASGLWGLCRHPNYFGCLLMAVAWSLPCGLTSPLTYLYIIYMLLVFVLRTRRDSKACQEKHGSTAWSEYCQRVRSRLIPFIF